MRESNPSRSTLPLRTPTPSPAPNNEIDDGRHNTRSARTTLVAVTPLGCHRFAVPLQQRVGCDHGCKLVQHLVPECLRFSGESTAFRIGARFITAINGKQQTASLRPTDQFATACVKLQRVKYECRESPFLSVKLGPNLDQVMFHSRPNSEMKEKSRNK